MLYGVSGNSGKAESLRLRFTL